MKTKFIVTVPRFDFRVLQCKGQLMSPCISCLFWNPWFSVLPNFSDPYIFNLFHGTLPPCLTVTSILPLERNMLIVSYGSGFGYRQEALPWPSSSCACLHKMRCLWGQENVSIWSLHTSLINHPPKFPAWTAPNLLPGPDWSSFMGLSFQEWTMPLFASRMTEGVGAAG